MSNFESEVRKLIEAVESLSEHQMEDRMFRKWDERVLPAIAGVKWCASAPGRAVLEDVIAERSRQDGKWGGPQHDDQKSPNDFVQHIEDYAGWARVMAGFGGTEGANKYRRRMVQVAALAVAAVEAMDRAMGSGKDGGNHA